MGADSVPGRKVAKVVPHRRMRAVAGELAWRLLLVTVGLASSALVAFAAIGLGTRGWPGFWIDMQDRVVEVDPAGPVAGRVSVGDAVLQIDGRDPGHGPVLLGRTVGKEVRYLLASQGSGSTYEVTVRLATPPPAVLWPYVQIPLAAAGLWAMGALLLAIPIARLLPLFILSLAGVVSLAGLYPERIAWAQALFNLSIAPVTALAVHLHLRFPRSLRGRWSRALSVAFFGAAVAIVLREGARMLADLSILPSVRTGDLQLLLLLAALGASLALLLRGWSSSPTPEARADYGIILLGTGIGLLPLLIGSVLPNLLLGYAIVPYDLAFLFLLLVPASYVLAGYQQHRRTVAGHFRRPAVHVLLVALLLSIFVIGLGAAERWLPSEPGLRLATAATLTLLAGLQLPRARVRLQRTIDRILYGGWYDYRSVMESILGELPSTIGRLPLYGLLCDRLREGMRLERAAIFVPSPDAFTLGYPEDSGVSRRTPILLASLADHLLSRGEPMDLGEVTRVPPESAEEIPHDFSLWVPLIVDGRLRGVLGLGRKSGGEGYSPEDRALLTSLAASAAIALERVELVEELQTKAEEARRNHEALQAAYRQAAVIKEDERARLARELHDVVVQELIGLGLQLRSLRIDGADAAQPVQAVGAKLRSLVEDLRIIIQDLRPPELDHLGLASALRGYLAEVREQRGVRVSLRVSGDLEGLGESVDLAIFRCVQEAVTNAGRHGRAGRVEVSVERSGDTIDVSVRDDGVGFEVPRRLGELALEGHYGLVTMHERMQIVDGSLSIESAPGQGTAIRATIPFPVGPALAKEQPA